jgi:hypothetical protein
VTRGQVDAALASLARLDQADQDWIEALPPAEQQFILSVAALFPGSSFE